MTARPVPTGYLPRPRRQLTSGRYAGANCGPVSTAHAVDWSSGGRVHPSPEAVRDALGGTWSGPGDATSLEDQARAWATYRDDARRMGLRLGRYTRMLVKPWSEVIDALDAGHGIVLQIDYPTIRRRRPHLSGDPNFGGLHVVFIPRRRPGALLSFDGLYDGRKRAWGQAPKGPQWVPGWVAKEAAEVKIVRSLLADETFAQGKPDQERRRLAKERADGNAVFAIVTRSTPIVKPLPEPEPEPEPTPEPCEARLAKSTYALAVLQGIADEQERELEAQDARITALEVALGTARTALVAAGEGIDEALADIEELLPDDPDVDAEPVDGVGDET